MGERTDPDVGQLVDLHARIRRVHVSTGDLGWIFTLTPVDGTEGAGWLGTFPMVDDLGYYTGEDGFEQVPLAGLGGLLERRHGQLNADWTVDSDDETSELQSAGLLVELLSARVGTEWIGGLTVNGLAVAWDRGTLTYQE